VTNTLRYSKDEQRERERWADYVDTWAGESDLSRWENWAGWLVSTEQRMSKSVHERLCRLQRWLFRRVWPSGLAPLRDSFENFMCVLTDLLLVYERHSVLSQDGYFTKRFYHIDKWDDALYHRLLAQYEDHTALVEDLVYELTRAANYVCDRVREKLLPEFRLAEGMVTIRKESVFHRGSGGPSIAWVMLRPQYAGRERTRRPYPGLERFMQVRSTRDVRIAREERTVSEEGGIRDRS
jgi:hypothetical protein